MAPNDEWLDPTIKTSMYTYKFDPKMTESNTQELVMMIKTLRFSNITRISLLESVSVYNLEQYTRDRLDKLEQNILDRIRSFITISQEDMGEAGTEYRATLNLPHVVTPAIKNLEDRLDYWEKIAREQKTEIEKLEKPKNFWQRLVYLFEG